MNQLEIFERNGKLWTDSREVAAMIDKQHFNLLNDIRGYIATLEKNTELNFQVSDFFLESSYMDKTGRTLPCFLISKKGCEFVANKLTGDKGVIFTATYVNRFNEYEEFIKHGYASANTTFAEYIKAVGLVAGDLRVNDTSKIIMYQKAFKSYDLPTEFLPDYEDTEMEPEKIITGKELAEIACAMNLLKTYQTLGNVEELSALVKAREDGLLVRPPCKVGDTVYGFGELG